MALIRLPGTPCNGYTPSRPLSLHTQPCVLPGAIAAPFLELDVHGHVPGEGNGVFLHQLSF
jgi:hypothetical protein